MKKITFAVLLLGLVACGNSENDKVTTDSITNSASASDDKKGPMPQITFEEETFDFGRITQGEKVSHAFAFTNTGEKNLIISGASGSCGCTVPDWPKEPVKPGSGGQINVVFSSEGKSGYQEKTVTVVTNCEPATKVVRIKAEVIVAETAK